MVSIDHDPMKHLPSEVVVVIFRNLAMRDQVICLAVSKGWNTILESTKSLWTTLHISLACQPISFKALEQYLRRSHFTVHSVRLHLESFANPLNVRYLMDTCHELIDLKIYGEGTLSLPQAAVLATGRGIQKLHLLNETQVDHQTMMLVFEICRKTLKEAKFWRVIKSGLQARTSWLKMNALTSIHLDFFDSLRFELSELIVATPNIRTAVINNCMPERSYRLDMTLWPDLERLEFTKAYIDHFPRLPPRLKHLVLDRSCNLYSGNIDDNDGIFSLSLLETFSFEHNLIDSSSIFAITDSCIRANNLKTLRLGGIFRHRSEVTLFDYFPASSTLEELSLKNLDMWDEDAIEIVKLYPSLKKIDLSYNLITEVTVMELVDRGVKSINVNYCYDVYHETVKKLRAKGTHILHAGLDDTISTCGEIELKS